MQRCSLAANVTYFQNSFQKCCLDSGCCSECTCYLGSLTANATQTQSNKQKTSTQVQTTQFQADKFHTSAGNSASSSTAHFSYCPTRLVACHLSSFKRSIRILHQASINLFSQFPASSSASCPSIFSRFPLLKSSRFSLVVGRGSGSVSEASFLS